MTIAVSARRILPLCLATAALGAAGAARASEELTLVLVGQALIKTDLRATAPAAVEQARTAFAGADVVFTNLEAAVAPKDTAFPRRAPNVEWATPEALDGLRAMGFNLLSLANNHALDLGVPGMMATRQMSLDRGFVVAGTGADAAEAARPGVLATPRGRVALVAAAMGGVQLTPATWADDDRAGVTFIEMTGEGDLNPRQRDRVLAAVRTARTQADVVIAYLHSHYWGAARGIDGPPGREKRIDRFTTPDWLRRLGHDLVGAGATVVVVHGNPGLHGVELHGRGVILHGLGNYIFQSIANRDRFGPFAYLSSIVELRFRDGALAGARLRPVVLGLEGEARGVPYLAQGGEAAAIVHLIAGESSRYGTRWELRGDSATLVLPADAAGNR